MVANYHISHEHLIYVILLQKIEYEYVVKRVMAMEVPGKRRRGRPKSRWLDSTRNDLSARELSREDTQDRAKWRRLIRHIDPT